jgi:hypothetical protein
LTLDDPVARMPLNYYVFSTVVDDMLNRLVVLVSLVFVFLVAGCSHTLHERDKDESNPSDTGSETKFQIQGPRAVVRHAF